MSKIKIAYAAALIPSFLLLWDTRTFAVVSTPSESAPSAKANPKTISTLYLFVHPTGTWDSTAVRAEYMAKWKALISAEAPNEESAIWLITCGCGGDSAALNQFAQEAFGERAFIDPIDESPATKVLIADDLERTLSKRGSVDGWVPYEMQANVTSRKWTEGLKKMMQSRGVSYDPKTLRIVACGQQWIGCLTKYAVFMSAQLGVSKPPEIQPELSHYAGFPLRVKYRECVQLDRHVQLYLFETVDQRPVAQFVDGLRAVWEPPHVAIVPADAAKFEIICSQPNSYQPAVGYPTSSVNQDGMVVDVADGSRPIIATIVARNMAYDQFREVMTKATIMPLRYATKVYIPVGGVSELLDTPENNPDAGR